MKTIEKQKKTSRAGRIILRVLCTVVTLVIAFLVVTGVISFIGNKANASKIASFDTVSYENQLVPTLDENGYYTFVTDRDFKIVQLTDVHIGGGWMSLRKDANALNAVAAMLTQEKPDLVIVTGDIAYPVPFQSGTINNKTPAGMFAQLMEKLGIYWTVSFGNHDTELYSLYDRDEIADFYSFGFDHCLLQKGPEDVDGSCNHIINVKNTKGIITQSIFILDSHAYTDGDYLGIKWKYDNIHENQIEWYKNSLNLLRRQNADAYAKISETEKTDLKSLIFFHIPPTEMRDAWNEFAENGYKDTENVKAVYGFMGGSGKVVFCGMHEDEMVETAMQEGSTQGIFFGHDHRNNISFDYNGIRLTYSMSVDYLAIPGISKIGRQRGCTVINVSPDGSFESHNENYYQEKYASVFEKETVEIQEITYPYSGD